VATLDQSNFHIESKSSTLKIVGAAARHRAPRALLLVDLSGSMRSDGELGVIAALARGFVNAAPAQAPLALVTFSDRVKERLDFSAPKEVLQQKLLTISQEPPSTPGGRTALMDTLTEATAMFGTPQSGDMIFLISDGGDNLSHARFSSVKKLLLERGMRLFSFIPFNQEFPTEEVRIGPGALTDLTNDTGGRSMTFERLSRSGWDNSPDALARDNEMGKYMYVLAASSYDLKIELDREIKSPIALKLRMVGADGKELRNLQLLYPRELMPCTQPNP
jgi:Mg-chelatase subunit ChlD